MMCLVVSGASWLEQGAIPNQVSGAMWGSD